MFLKKTFLFIALTLFFSYAFSYADKGNVVRYALYVAANDGGDDLEILRYAEKDARELSKTMIEIGGIPKENSIVLVDPSLDQIDKALNYISSEVSKSSRSAKRVEFFFYYSGHSDEKALLIKNNAYPYTKLKDNLNKVPSDVHVVMLDSCYSGNFVRAKGGTKQKSFLVDDSTLVEGHAYLSSSSSNEQSQESDVIQSSFFTHALITGLRGAADTSNDNKVSLNELYSYARNSTLSNTEHSRNGPQHPSYDIKLRGSGDLVLTDISSAESTISFSSETEGRFLIRDSSNNLVSEFEKVKDTQVAIAIPEGRYTVTAITKNKTSQGVINVEKYRTYIFTNKDLRLVETTKNRARGRGDTEILSEEPEKEVPLNTEINDFSDFSDMKIDNFFDESIDDFSKRAENSSKRLNKKNKRR